MMQTLTVHGVEFDTVGRGRSVRSPLNAELVVLHTKGLHVGDIEVNYGEGSVKLRFKSIRRRGTEQGYEGCAGTYVLSPVRPMVGSSRWCTGQPPLHHTLFLAAGCAVCMPPHRPQRFLLAGSWGNLKHQKGILFRHEA